MVLGDRSTAVTRSRRHCHGRSGHMHAAACVGSRDLTGGATGHQPRCRANGSGVHRDHSLPFTRFHGWYSAITPLLSRDRVSGLSRLTIWPRLPEPDSRIRAPEIERMSFDSRPYQDDAWSPSSRSDCGPRRRWCCSAQGRWARPPLPTSTLATCPDPRAAWLLVCSVLSAQPLVDASGLGYSA